MASSLRVLLVEDCENDAALVLRELRRCGYATQHLRVDTMEGLEQALSQPWDLAICDYSLPAFSVLDALRHIQSRGLDMPFIVVSGIVGEETAVVTMKHGAHDYLMKSNLTRLGVAVERELRDAGIRAERNQVVKELRERDESLRELIERSPDAVAVMREGLVMYANPAFIRLLDLPDLNALMGKDLRTLVGTDALSGPNLRWQRRDASVMEVEARLQDVPFNGMPCTLVLARDVSEQRALMQARAQVDRLVAVGTLAASVGHEINNPLAYVMANLNYAANELPVLAAEAQKLGESGKALCERLEAMREAMSEATEGAERVRTIVRDLKTFSRKSEEGHVAVDLKQVLDSALNIARGELRTRAQPVVEYGELPKVWGTESRLGQVFLNLLINAAQAIPAGAAVRNKVTLRARVQGPDVVVEVADTGTGIAPENLSRIFEAFYTTKPSGQGTGLGLPICQDIVRAVGGDITVESVLGEGTTFRVRLPRAESAAGAAVAAPAPTDGVLTGRARILFVDNEPMLGLALQRMLGKDHEVIAVTDGRQALARLQGGEHFDAVFSDLLMPEMTGMELYDTLLKSRPDIAQRMVFLTGGVYTELARDFLARVPNARLEKPVDLNVVSAELSRVLAAPGSKS